MTFGPDPGELPGFLGPMVFCHAHIPWKGSGNQQQQHISHRRILKFYKQKENRGKKMSKEILVVLVGSNATGTHQLKLAVFGKLQEARAFKELNVEGDMPVI